MLTEERDPGLYQTVQTGHKPFSCEVCGKRFKLKYHLTLHAIIHSRDNSQDSAYRQEIFTENSNRVLYETVPTGDKPFSCEVCDKSFKLKNHLALHFRVHRKDKSDKSEYSQGIIAEESNHMLYETVRTGEKPFGCEVCGRSFAYKRHLTKHVKAHEQVKVVETDYFQQMLREEPSLVQHKSIYMREKPVCCEICGRGFTRKCHLANHIKAHMREKCFVADLSQEETDTKENVLADSAKRRFSCELCGENFPEKSHLDNHTRVHRRDNSFGTNYSQESGLAQPEPIPTMEKPFTCELCDRSFKRKYDLALHAIVHRRDTSFEPVPCSRRILTEDSVIVQHETISMGEDPFNCEFCGRTFPQKCHLVSHSKVHTGNEKSFLVKTKKKSTAKKSLVSKFCGKRFKRKHHLARHTSEHENEKSFESEATDTSDRLFSCALCGESFPKRAFLVNHAKVHIEDKLFEFEGSQQTIKEEIDLMQHDAICPGEQSSSRESLPEKDGEARNSQDIDVDKPFSCEQCDESFTQEDHLTLHAKIHGIDRSSESEGEILLLVHNDPIHIKGEVALCELRGKNFSQLGYLTVDVGGHNIDTSLDSDGDQQMPVKTSRN
ncbi:Zinc finger, C2H2 type [Popillia japonica]|uniref:Zinc finger, C2H2 type n=1 Tax=Popillia japonica TaxID=7064 RepID=A0AAW1MWS3_POPJA